MIYAAVVLTVAVAAVYAIINAALGEEE